MGFDRGKFSGRAVALFAVLGLAALTLVPAASASTWTEAQLPGRASHIFLLGVSCPSPSLCVAVGTDNLIASSTNPTSGAAAWSFGHAGEGASPYIPDDAPQISGRQIQGVSCPSLNLCVAVTSQGNIYSTTRPTGPASEWAVTPIDEKGHNTHLEGISCPSVSLCVAVTGARNDSGKVLTSTDPTGGPSAWQTTLIDETLDLRAVSCGSPSLCVAVGDEGRIVTSTNPTGGSAAWNVVGAPGGPGSLRGVSCVATALCVTGNKGGNLLVSTSPAAGLSSWGETDGGGSVQITGASCPSATECLVVDNNGDVLTSTDPAGGRAAWSFANLVPYTPVKGFVLEGNALFAASCPSRSFCALTGARGQIFTSVDPFARASAPAPSGPAGRGRGPKRPRVKIATVRLPFRKQLLNHTAKATIRFYANGRVRRFVCKFDRGPFRQCRSPKRYRVGVGEHVFRVRAIGLTGLKGPIAVERFTVHPLCKGIGPQRRPSLGRPSAASPAPLGTICL